MFAIIRSGGKQYRVESGDVVRLESLNLEAGNKVEFAALFVGGDSVKFGKDAEKVKVIAEVVEHGRGKKIYVRKYKSGIQYRRRNGHRQSYTAVKITDIKA